MKSAASLSQSSFDLVSILLIRNHDIVRAMRSISFCHPHTAMNVGSRVSAIPLALIRIEEHRNM